jgi:hypothetical protein
MLAWPASRRMVMARFRRVAHFHLAQDRAVRMIERSPQVIAGFTAAD